MGDEVDSLKAENAQLKAEIARFRADMRKCRLTTRERFRQSMERLKTATPEERAEILSRSRQNGRIGFPDGVDGPNHAREAMLKYRPAE